MGDCLGVISRMILWGGYPWCRIRKTCSWSVIILLAKPLGDLFNGMSMPCEVHRRIANECWDLECWFDEQTRLWCYSSWQWMIWVVTRCIGLNQWGISQHQHWLNTCSTCGHVLWDITSHWLATNCPWWCNNYVTMSNKLNIFQQWMQQL